MPLPLSLVAIGFFSFVPGWLLLLQWPGLHDRLALRERVAVSAGLSAVLLVGVGLALARVGLFSSGPMLGIELGIIVIGTYMAREKLSRALPKAGALRKTLPKGWGSRAESLLPLLAFAAVLAPFVHYALGGVRTRIVPWGYMSDISALMRAGGIPESSVQWGVERPYALSKLGGYIWVASLRTVSGLGEMDALQYINLVFLVVALLGAWVFLRLFMGRIAASAGLLLLFANYPLVSLPFLRFTHLTIEGVALSLPFLVLWAVIKSDRRRIPQLRWLAVAWLLLIGVTHGVVFLMTILSVGVYVATKVLARVASWRSLARDATLYFVAPVVLVSSGVLVGSAVEIFAGASSESDYELVNGVGDPTRALQDVIQGGSINEAPPPQTGLSPSPRWYLENIFPPSEFSGNRTWLAKLVAEHSTLLLAWLLIMAVGGVLIARHLRWAFVGLAMTVAAILVVAILFSFRYDLWIFTAHPVRREFKYVPVVVTLMGLLLFQARRMRFSMRRPRARQITLALTVAAVPALLYSMTVFPGAPWRGSVLGGPERQTMAWIRDNTPPDSRILANVRTVGGFDVQAGRESLTEGGVPHLFPDLLTHTLQLLDGAQAWFAKPNPAFLSERGVDYVVVHVGRRSSTVGLSGNLYAPVGGERRFRVLDYLQREARFGRIFIYSVLQEKIVQAERVSQPGYSPGAPLPATSRTTPAK